MIYPLVLRSKLKTIKILLYLLMIILISGRPDKKNDVMDYVLEDFNRNERNQLAAMKDTMIDTVHQIIAVILSPPGKICFQFSSSSILLLYHDHRLVVQLEVISEVGIWL